ncbi:MAG: MBL fold metallo-hydrolase [Nitrospira bacterium HGW-Nitrospira-1]|nr:MAG: MBL fold metallo-hydrolase [Nitrospira bacterium HGW-Nitrospira-1]
MKIKGIVVGPLQVNCFIAYDEDSLDAIVVDPGDEPEKISSFLKDRNLQVSSIVCTHAHFDHIGAVRRLKEKTGAQVILHKGDYEMYMQADKQGIAWGFQIEQPPEPDIYVLEGNEVAVGRFRLKVLHTPGHSPGGICLFGEGVIFTGDTIFADSVGRTDLPGGSMAQLKESFDRIISLPPRTKIFPGHGPLTTVEDEKENRLWLFP